MRGGIVVVLENRAKADGNSIYDQVSDNTQVFGWDKRNQINEAGVDKKRLKNATAGTIEGILVDNSEKDYSGGGYYWQGTDFEKHTAKSNAYELFYLNEGFHFTKKSHDIWGLGDNKVPGSHVIYPLIPGSTTKHQKVTATWNYKYESTGTGGKTTFMKLTEDYRLGQDNKPAKY
jgi:hypothetical protein